MRNFRHSSHTGTVVVCHAAPAADGGSRVTSPTRHPGRHRTDGHARPGPRGRACPRPTTTRRRPTRATRAAAAVGCSGHPLAGPPRPHDRAPPYGPVRPPTGLAVRYHAWTAELIRAEPPRPRGHALPRAGAPDPGGRLRGRARPRGTSRRRAAQPRAARHAPASTAAAADAQRHPAHPEVAARRPDPHPGARPGRRGWPGTTTYLPSSRSRSPGRSPAGSSAGSPAPARIGVMQVMPDTGRWMRWYAGRPLRLRDTHDNIQAGVLTLRILRSWTKYDNNAIARVLPGPRRGAEARLLRATPSSTSVAVRAHQRRLHPHRQPDLDATGT